MTRLSFFPIIGLTALLLSCGSSWTGIKRPAYKPVKFSNEEVVENYAYKIFYYDCKEPTFDNAHLKICIANRSELGSSIADKLDGYDDVFGLEMLLTIENETSEKVRLNTSDIYLLDDSGETWGLRKWEFVSLTVDKSNTTIFPGSDGGWLLYFGSAYYSQDEKPDGFIFNLNLLVGYERVKYEAAFDKITWPEKLNKEEKDSQ